MKRGWIVTFSGLGINLALGVLYVWTAIASTLTRSAADGGRFFWTPQQAMLPYAVAVGCFSLSMLIAGRLQDAFGPRLVATGGGALVGVGMLVASLSPAHLVSPNAIPLHVVLGFGVLAGCGIGLAYAATTPAAAKWSSAGRRGIVLGVVVSGFGGAAVFAHPLVAALVRAYGLSGTFLFLGVVLFVVIVGLAQLLADPPVGFVPPGSYTEELSSIGPKTAAREYTAGQTVRAPSLYALWAALACSAFGIHVVSPGATDDCCRPVRVSRWNPNAHGVLCLGAGSWTRWPVRRGPVRQNRPSTHDTRGSRGSIGAHDGSSFHGHTRRSFGCRGSVSAAAPWRFSPCSRLPRSTSSGPGTAVRTTGSCSPAGASVGSSGHMR